MNRKSTLRIEHSGDSGPRLRWGNSYSLLHLADSQAPIRLPGRPVLPETTKLHESPRILVFGERSGGGRDFISWWRSTLDKAGHCWIYAQGEKWRRSFFEPETPESHKKNEALGEKNASAHALLARGKEALEQFGGIRENSTSSRTTDAERAEVLVTWASELKRQNKTVHLIFRDLEGLGTDGEALSMATALRISGENQAVKTYLRILVVSTSEERFADLADASGFGNMCDRFRLAWFNLEEIDFLARRYCSNAKELPTISLDAECLNFVMEGTGGQPYLVQSLLQLLTEKKWAMPSSGQVRTVLREMRKSPPQSVTYWKSDLERRLDINKVLEDPLRAFVAGYTQAEPLISSELSALVLCGWLRYDLETLRWKISSKIHRNLALEVLDKRGGR